MISMNWDNWAQTGIIWRRIKLEYFEKWTVYACLGRSRMVISSSATLAILVKDWKKSNLASKFCRWNGKKIGLPESKIHIRQYRSHNFFFTDHRDQINQFHEPIKQFTIITTFYFVQGPLIMMQSSHPNCLKLQTTSDPTSYKALWEERIQSHHDTSRTMLGAGR